MSSGFYNSKGIDFILKHWRVIFQIELSLLLWTWKLTLGVYKVIIIYIIFFVAIGVLLIYWSIAMVLNFTVCTIFYILCSSTVGSHYRVHICCQVLDNYYNL